MQLFRSEAAFPILNRIKEITVEKGTCTVAIDGNSGSGKSTLASRLSAASNALLIHMDDFFLPPELKTPERLAAPGGNIDSDRFLKEVINGISSGHAFYYHTFSCCDRSYTRRSAPYSPIRILEGVYSMHPAWQNYLDLKIFLQISPDLQKERILQRSGEEMLKNFIEKWIPMENRYFDFYKIRETCDYIIV